MTLLPESPLCRGLLWPKADPDANKVKDQGHNDIFGQIYENNVSIPISI